ncbi:MAG: hypothetical protein WD669_02535 [Pirellulales bacterium]
MGQPMPFCRILLPSLAALLFSISIAGCGSKKDFSRYLPPPELSERALDAALTAWRDGSQAPVVLDDKTRVEFVDDSRRPGQSLKEFRILGEVSRDAGRYYEVQLELDQPSKVENRRYLVIGINPLWVFRQADYEMLSHWDMPPEPVKKAKDVPQTLAGDKDGN